MPLLPRLIASQGQVRPALLLLMLMLGSAATEGIGLIMLVPILAVLDPGSNGSGPTVTAFLGPMRHQPALLLALFVSLVMLRGTMNLLRSLTLLRLETGLADSLRRRAWRALLHCDWRELASMRKSESASLLISNIDRVGAGVQNVMGAVAAMITLAALGLAALMLSPGVAFSALACGALVLVAYRGIRRRAGELGAALGAAYSTVYSRLAEGLGALRVIKSLGRESESEAEVFEGFAKLHDVRREFARSSGLAQLALQGGGAALLALLVWLAIARWGMGMGTILPLVALFARALPLLGTVQDAWQNWAHSRPALDAALGLIARAEAAREPDVGEVAAPLLAEAIVLDGVAVQFAGQPLAALSGIDLTLRPREVLALTGPSGAGKSTLADLLAGLISPDAGAIAIDGQPLDPASRRAWRARVAYVEQDPVLLSDTIRANLTWAAPESDEAQLRAALDAAAAGFVHALPQGIDTPVGDGGRRLSGGERQRLMLARALLRDPALLVLDEATSALDPGNEAAVAEALKRLRGRMAIVIICHRGALLGLADREARLDRGRLVELVERRA